MPEDGVVQIAVDRYLLPFSVSRQAVLLLEASGQPVPPEQSPNVIYDPIARTVTLTRPRPGPWLTADQPYKIRFTIPKSDEDTAGLRAIDGATLDPAQPLEISFFVAKTPGPARSLAAAMGEPENVSFCKDVLPIFQQKCGSSSCHGSGGNPASGLLLDTPEGIRATAINHAAHGANTGNRSLASSEGRTFGIDMPLISVDVGTSPPVGIPGSSWLVYKIDLARTSAITPKDRLVLPCVQEGDRAQEAPYVGLAPVITAGDERERAVLSDFVLGREMPYPGTFGDRYDEQPLTFQERETVRMWIARGAPTPACDFTVNGCKPSDFQELGTGAPVAIAVGGASPRCVRVSLTDGGKAEAAPRTVTFQGDFATLPLEPFGGACTSPIVPTSTGSSASFTFATPGTYGFRLVGAASPPLTGAIEVRP